MILSINDQGATIKLIIILSFSIYLYRICGGSEIQKILYFLILS